ncbi:hypothetical protein ACIRPR_33475 [Streptomyces griseoflavus]|uniref:hypothetical protein n=1 Tax=Streptomyces griseoflavus TaxID=35619 RepID=UPI00381D0062
MTTFRDVLALRQARIFKNALAVLAGVTRREDDPHAVRITITSPDGEQSYGSLCLGLMPLIELCDAARARSTDIARFPQTGPQSAAPVLRLVEDGGEKR